MYTAIQKITPFLWFDDRAEEAANFYASIFANSKIEGVTRYGEGGPRPAGTVMTVAFQLEGQQFVGLNGGPHFQFTEAISLVVNCRNQEEVDYYWEKLSAGGQEVQCGWLKDKYGLSWQVVPTIVSQAFQQVDTATATRVMQAILKMKKLIVADLEEVMNAPA
ncbi:MAG: VOC family protein [Candidatus Solibacter sp.]